MKNFFISLGALVAMAASALGCLIYPGPTPPPVETRPVVFSHEDDLDQVLNSSWYGEFFQDLPTASGVPFDRWAFTCASRVLPMHTKLLLTNPLSGRRARVEINDRGPYVYSRQLDCSEGVAYELGYHEKGVTKLVAKRVQ